MLFRSPEASEWVVLGLLGKARGLRGDVWFRPYNDASIAVDVGRRVRLTLRDRSQREAVVEAVAMHGQEHALRFRGVEDRDAAEALVGATVSLQRKDFPPLEEGEFYHCDLAGLRVVDVSGRPVGAVLRVEAYPTVDAIRMAPDHPDRASLRQTFLAEHTHSEDEVRFFVEGRGLFCLHIGQEVLQVQCAADDWKIGRAHV